MKIVVLDGYTLNPGDLSWQPLAELGELTVYERTHLDDILARSQGAQILLTNDTPLSHAVITALPELRCIGILGTGYNHIDIISAGERGIAVMNCVNYGTSAVAEHGMALLLALCRSVSLHDHAVRQGTWTNCPDFCFWQKPQYELTGKTCGIIGFGTIGQYLGRLAHAFGMRIVAASTRVNAQECQARHQVDYPVSYLDLDDIWAAVDILSLNCPMTKANQGFINAHTLAKMKKGALLLNLARGGLLNEADVAQALHSKHLAGLAVDVVSQEPISANNPLLHAPNTLITPHMAWTSLPARQNIMRIMRENILAWRNNNAQNVVNTAYLKTR